MTSIHWAHMGAQENHNITIIIIINHKANVLPTTHAKIHNNTITMQSHIGMPKYLHQLENQYTTIISINNQNPPSGNLQIPNATTANILGLFNIKVKTHPHQNTPPSNKSEMFPHLA